MRVEFNLKPTEELSFRVDGVSYGFSTLMPLARKERPATHIHEYVYELPQGQFIYVTVVGDEVHDYGSGVLSGWYVVEKLTQPQAEFMIDALAKFTARYLP